MNKLLKQIKERFKKGKSMTDEQRRAFRNNKADFKLNLRIKESLHNASVNILRSRQLLQQINHRMEQVTPVSLPDGPLPRDPEYVNVFNQYLVKEFDYLSNVFAHTGLTLDEVLKHSDNELMLKLKYGRFGGKRGWHSTNQSVSNKNRFLTVGGETSARAYIQLMKQSEVDDLSDELYDFLHSVMKKAADLGIGYEFDEDLEIMVYSNDPFELLEYALIDSASDETYTVLMRKYFINGKSLTEEEQVILESTILGKMKEKDELLNKSVYVDLDEKLAADEKRLGELSADVSPEAVREMKSLVSEHQELMTLSQESYQFVVPYVCNTVLGNPVNTDEMIKREKYITHILEQIYSR